MPNFSYIDDSWKAFTRSCAFVRIWCVKEDLLKHLFKFLILLNYSNQCISETCTNYLVVIFVSYLN